ncbi:tetratricopeptide repeat protein [Cellulomonas sp. NS3]|uniref:tetratricopeptide repeat protein n=1 Tax=Cellulomonas sp. NS3 TaxID=2973977 RepID=UPI002163CE48|nr:tetratricopeptide repeat protein [Cellulomonas sp. NS3]
MSQPSAPQPRLDVRGAIDLSSLARPSTPPPGAPGGPPAAGGFVVDVDEASFGQLVQDSTTYPVVVLLWAPWSQVSVGLAADLGTLADEYAGRFLLARIDGEANPQIARAFGVQSPQSLPVAVAVVAGQPLPLFQGAYPIEQVRGVIDQVIAAAAANGVTGTVPGTGAAATDEPEEPPLPPLHQAAYDAIERDDLPAAQEAYSQALRENPRDAMARAGLAQVGLLSRTRDADLNAARRAAADDPRDVAAQLLVADLDVLGGKIEDAFGRLVDLVRVTAGPERERVRLHLVELFEVVGSEDPRVGAARRALANALY